MRMKHNTKKKNLRFDNCRFVKLCGIVEINNYNLNLFFSFFKIKNTKKLKFDYYKCICYYTVMKCRPWDF